MSQTQCSACPQPPSRQCPTCLAVDRKHAARMAKRAAKEARA
ncbi:MAG: hypothetical protein WC718_15255 [Phycisphaerales bacterium]